MCQRSISHEQIILLARWLDTEPQVPDGKWYKKFPGFTVCGEGELIKTSCSPVKRRTDRKFVETLALIPAFSFGRRPG